MQAQEQECKAATVKLQETTSLLSTARQELEEANVRA